MEIEVKGIDSLREKLKKLPQILNQATNQAMFEVTETIRSTAEDNAPVGIYTGGGELKGSIHAIVDNEDGKIVGRVWSDKKQAIFTEFGTGPRGQASPKDLPEGIEPVYTQERWFIPADLLAPGVAEAYHFRQIKIDGQVFYICYGQPAQPWLYPAIKENKDKIPEVMSKYIEQGLGGV